MSSAEGTLLIIIAFTALVILLGLYLGNRSGNGGGSVSVTNTINNGGGGGGYTNDYQAIQYPQIQSYREPQRHIDNHYHFNMIEEDRRVHDILSRLSNNLGYNSSNNHEHNYPVHSFGNQSSRSQDKALQGAISNLKALGYPEEVIQGLIKDVYERKYQS